MISFKFPTLTKTLVLTIRYERDILADNRKYCANHERKRDARLTFDVSKRFSSINPDTHHRIERQTRHVRQIMADI